MNFLHVADIQDGVYIMSEPDFGFERAYLQVRKKESRLLTDQLVLGLPNTPVDYTHHKEWRLREVSCNRLLSYLKQCKPNTALDLGCGNGWFSNKLATACQQVVGVDINMEELRQACRVFSKDGLSFCYADIFSAALPRESFDVITINASVQYFPDIQKLIILLLQLVTPNGEIHLIDSPFYTLDEVDAAKERTEDHYSRFGCSEMASFYYHHQWSALAPFNYETKLNPSKLSNRFWRKLGLSSTIFPWIIIRK